MNYVDHVTDQNNVEHTLVDNYGRTMVAPVEETSTSSAAYAVGDFLILEGILYKVTTAIAIGDTITPGTNCVATKIADELGETLGTKLTATVSGNTVSFTDAGITVNSIFDGPYVADILASLDDVSINGTTVTFTFEDTLADGKTAYIWVRG